MPPLTRQRWRVWDSGESVPASQTLEVYLAFFLWPYVHGYGVSQNAAIARHSCEADEVRKTPLLLSLATCGSAMQHTGINEQLSATASTVGLISLGSTSKLIRDGHGNWWRRQCHRSGRGAFSKTCVILKHWQGWQQKIGNGRRQNGKRVNERASKRERRKRG